jgi:hypothetical protein
MGLLTLNEVSGLGQDLFMDPRLADYPEIYDLLNVLMTSRDPAAVQRAEDRLWLIEQRMDPTSPIGRARQEAEDARDRALRWELYQARQSEDPDFPSDRPRPPVYQPPRIPPAASIRPRAGFSWLSPSTWFGPSAGEIAAAAERRRVAHDLEVHRAGRARAARAAAARARAEAARDEQRRRLAYQARVRAEVRRTLQREAAARQQARTVTRPTTGTAHPGITHSAGAPRSGTFVDMRSVDIRPAAIRPATTRPTVVRGLVTGSQTLVQQTSPSYMHMPDR